MSHSIYEQIVPFVRDLAAVRTSENIAILAALSSTNSRLRTVVLPFLFSHVRWPHPNKHDEETGLHFFPENLWPLFKRFDLIWPDDWPDASPPRWGDRYYVGGDYHPRHTDKLATALPKMPSLLSFSICCPFFPPNSLFNALLTCTSVRELRMTDTPLYISMIPKSPPEFVIERLYLIPVAEALRVGQSPYESRYSSPTIYHSREYRRKYKNDILARYAASAFLFDVGKPTSLTHVQVSGDLCTLDEFFQHDWPRLVSLVMTGHPPRQTGTELVDVISKMPQLKELRLLFAKSVARGDSTFKVLPAAPEYVSAKGHHGSLLSQVESLAVSDACNLDRVGYFLHGVKRFAVLNISDISVPTIGFTKKVLQKILREVSAAGTPAPKSLPPKPPSKNPHGPRDDEVAIAKLLEDDFSNPHVIFRNRGLEHLRVMLGENVDLELCQFMASRFPKLQVLELERCGYYDGNNVPSWTNYVDTLKPLRRTLKSLRLGMQFEATDNTIEEQFDESGQICVINEDVDEEPEVDEDGNLVPASWRVERENCASYFAQKMGQLTTIGFQYRKRPGPHRFDDRWIDWEIARRSLTSEMQAEWQSRRTAKLKRLTEEKARAKEEDRRRREREAIELYIKLEEERKEREEAERVARELQEQIEREEREIRERLEREQQEEEARKEKEEQRRRQLEEEERRRREAYRLALEREVQASAQHTTVINSQNGDPPPVPPPARVARSSSASTPSVSPPPVAPSSLPPVPSTTPMFPPPVNPPSLPPLPNNYQAPPPPPVNPPSLPHVFPPPVNPPSLPPLSQVQYPPPQADPPPVPPPASQLNNAPPPTTQLDKPPPPVSPSSQGNNPPAPQLSSPPPVSPNTQPKKSSTVNPVSPPNRPTFYSSPYVISRIERNESLPMIQEPPPPPRAPSTANIVTTLSPPAAYNTMLSNLTPSPSATAHLVVPAASTSVAARLAAAAAVANANANVLAASASSHFSAAASTSTTTSTTSTSNSTAISRIYSSPFVVTRNSSRTTMSSSSSTPLTMTLSTSNTSNTNVCNTSQSQSQHVNRQQQQQQQPETPTLSSCGAPLTTSLSSSQMPLTTTLAQAASAAALAQANDNNKNENSSDVEEADKVLSLEEFLEIVMREEEEEEELDSDWDSDDEDPEGILGIYELRKAWYPFPEVWQLRDLHEENVMDVVVEEVGNGNGINGNQSVGVGVGVPVGNGTVLGASVSIEGSVESIGVTIPPPPVTVNGNV